MLRHTAALALVLAATLAWAEGNPEAARIRQLLATDRPTVALAAARDWSLGHPADPEALELYARVQAQLGQFDGALDAYDSLYFLTRDVQALVDKGEVYLDWGHYDEARRTFQEALHRRESYAPAYAGLARGLLEQKEYAEAYAASEVALRIDPACVPAMLVVARLALAQGNYTEASNELAQAARMRADAAEVELWQGNLEALQGRLGPARVHWRRYVEQAPGTLTAWQLSRDLYPLPAGPYPCTGYYPTFSPDGKLLAYRGRGDSGSVYVSTVDHLDKFERIYQGTGNIYSLEWSPDSRRLLCREYSRQEVNGKPQFRYSLIVITPGPTPEVVRVYDGAYVGVCCWTPDSQAVWYDGYQAGFGRVIASVPASGGTPQVALTPLRSETLVNCLFSRDGRRFIIQRWFGQDKEYQILLTNPKDRSGERVLARSAQVMQYPTLSPDGRYLLYFQRSGPSWDVMMVGTDDNSLPLPLFRGLRSLMPLAFTADGRHLVVYSGEPMQLYDLAGLR